MALGLNAFGRWLRHSATGQWIVARVGAFYIWFAHATTRWTIHGLEHRAYVLSGHRGVLAAVWHGRLFLSPHWVPKRRRVMAIISNNRDGDLISGVVARFGVVPIRGSTYDHAKQRDKGGREVVAIASHELAENAAVIAITPDGPRGPRMRAQDGVGVLAIRTGAVIVPVAFASRSARVLRSWDRFVVPLPFGRGVQIYGPPIEAPRVETPETIEEVRRQVEETLNLITAEADRLCSQPMVEPAPPGPPRA